MQTKNLELTTIMNFETDLDTHKFMMAGFFINMMKKENWEQLTEVKKALTELKEKNPNNEKLNILYELSTQ